LVGAAPYLLWLFAHISYGCNEVNRWLGETHFESAREALFIYGFVGMTGMGAVAMLLPRLTGVECNLGGAKIVFQMAFTGLVLLVAGYAFAGMQQGAAWADESLAFGEVAKTGAGLLQMGVFGGLIMVAAAALFLFGTGSQMVRSLYAEYPVLEWIEDEKTETTEKEAA